MSEGYIVHFLLRECLLIQGSERQPRAVDKGLRIAIWAPQGIPSKFLVAVPLCRGE